ncbi:MAG: sigma-70 family RNA polymerase sigma factor [Anaerolineales bacterium]
MDSRTDAELLRLAHTYDRAALTAIYDRYNQPLYYYALRLLGDPSLAEDCVAETFARFLNAIRNGGGPENYLKAYLYRSIHNWISDYYRRQPPPTIELDDRLADDMDNDPAETVDAHITQQRVRNALRLLTPDQRQVIYLRYVEGWELDEVAQVIQKPVGAVKSLQHRALAALQKMLNPESSTAHGNYELEHALP